MTTITKKRTEEILKGFVGKKVLVIGDVMLDTYISGQVHRINPEAPSLILQAEETVHMLGGAGNVAKNAVALGAEVHLVGVVGTDETAHILEKLTMEGNLTSYLIKDATRPTTQKVRHLVGAHQLLRVDYESTHTISPEVEEQILARIEEELDSGIEVVYVSDYAKGFLTPRMAQALIGARDKGIFIAADVKPKNIALMKGVDLISPNKKEASEFLGLNPIEHTEITNIELARLLAEKLESEIYITLAGDGIAVWVSEAEQGHVRQEHSSEVVDVSGAGDTAVVMLTLSRVSGASPIEAATLANLAGAVVVGKRGAVSIAPQDILNLLERES